MLQRKWCDIGQRVKAMGTDSVAIVTGFCGGETPTPSVYFIIIEQQLIAGDSCCKNDGCILNSKSLYH